MAFPFLLFVVLAFTLRQVPFQVLPVTRVRGITTQRIPIWLAVPHAAALPFWFNAAL